MAKGQIPGWLRIAGGGVGLVASGYFIAFVYRTVTAYDHIVIVSARLIGAVTLAALCTASTLLVTSWAWARLLHGLGVRIRTRQLTEILGLTQIAKYLPGNVGQYLGRFALALRLGISPSSLMITLAAETLLLIAAGVLVGGLALVAAGHRLPILRLTSAPLVFALICVGLALILLSWGVRHLPWITRRLVPDQQPAAPLIVPDRPTLGAAFSAYVANFLLFGAGLWCIGVAVTGMPLTTYPLFVGVSALSWVVGFVVPAAPAGLGVREALMAALLAPVLNPANALTLIVSFRLATTAGDLLGFAWGGALYLARRGQVN
jgi:glycosyltransferase 2 family protein